MGTGMGNMGFDDRYPAMFQPGGDGLPVQKSAPLDSVPATGTATLVADEQHLDGLEVPESKPSNDPWTSRTWVVGISAALLSIAAGIFVLNASTVIPASRTAKPEDFLGMSVTPWGWLILDLGVPLIVAGAALVVFMLFLGSRQHPSYAKAMRAGMAAIGIGALVSAVLAVFYHNFFPFTMEALSGSSFRDWPIPWVNILNQAMPILAVFGLSVLVVLVVVRPTGTSGGLASSAKAAMVAGVSLLACAAFVLFAQLMFPLALGTQSVSDGMFQDIPWPQKIVALAAPLTLVGAGTLLWGVLIRVSSQHPANNLPEPLAGTI
ncbi:hypothetical protein CVS27_06800 [Arthrobacter glacialis]|uniref:Uncharacterized protein n=2 Tax=Arthrobacter glacialis TaxID=1664 RepID=A0A2S3ZY98_ARTGL|nr:hypothetical protein CVS27_06800 [Arthrobacter glacialis]